MSVPGAGSHLPRALHSVPEGTATSVLGDPEDKLGRQVLLSTHVKDEETVAQR